MASNRVGLLGATGETGSSILEGLVEDGAFEIVALCRPGSLEKPANIALKDRGLELRALSLESSTDDIAAALKGIDILISAIGPRDQLAQIPLTIAAKTAGVKRYVPCGFATPMPVGVHMSRDQKEEVYNLVKRLHIPYTIIDVGWWYQISIPALPSGKIDYAIGLPNQSIPGDGNVPSARTDLRDVGRYVARVIKDERTLNAAVFCYNELWSDNQVYDLLEKLSGEKLSRKYVKAEDYEKQIIEADAGLKDDPANFALGIQKKGAQYSLSVGIRGENTPEYATYLGYLDGKKLYPDVKFTSFETFLRGVVDGTAKGVYPQYKSMIEKALKSEREVNSF